MAESPFVPCGNATPVSRGWVPALGGSEGTLVHATAGRLLITLQEEEKILPAQVVARAVEERISEREARDGRKVPARERRNLRDELTLELLPRAFTRLRTTRALIDPEAGWLVVDSAARKRADTLVSLLRELLGSLPVRPPQPTREPALSMTTWLESGRAPDGFFLGEQCELRAPDGGAVVRLSGQSLDSEEVRAHLRQGLRVTRLALLWRGRLAFNLLESADLRQLDFEEVIDELPDPAATPGVELVEKAG